MNDDWLTPNEYAKIWHVVPQMVREYIWDGRVPAEKVGWRWMLPPGLEKPPTHRRYKEDFSKKEIAERRKRRKDYDARYYQKFVDAGICYSCKKRPAMLGFTRCEECIARRRRDYVQKYPDGRSEYHKERRRQLKEQGLCENCGKPATPGNVLCKRCKAKAAESQQVYHIRKRIERQNQKEMEALRHGNRINPAGNNP